MSEFAPKWSWAKMTPAQVRKYIKDMKKAQEIAQKKLEEAQNSPEADKEALELEILEKKIDNL